MSHFLFVPVNANGIIVDERIDVELQMAAVSPFRFNDVFLYSHGWWNTASNAAAEYNIFSIGFAKTLQQIHGELPKLPDNFTALALAVHWPSMISEDQDSIANFLEAASFFTMEHRADDVGQHADYSLLRLLIEARRGGLPLHFHLIGHSFGCRVLLSALQTLANDSDTMQLANQLQVTFNVALIQAAADAASLANDGMYGAVLNGIPQLRLLVTKSIADTALGELYPLAQKLVHLFKDPVPAMGNTGPTGALAVAAGVPIEIGAAPMPTPAGQLCIADLTPLHIAHRDQYIRDSGGSMPFGGQHSDINLAEVYELLARFFFG